MYETLTHPFLQLALLATSSLACLYLFLSAKGEIHRLERRLSGRIRGVEDKGAGQARLIETIETRLGTLQEWQHNHEEQERERRDREKQERTKRENPVEPRAKAQVVPLPRKPPQGLNQNKRAKVFQLASNGESSYTIADRVGMPRAEVDLLLKVHRCLGTIQS